jgi:tubulin polyglutamylase TTLL6/13
MQDPYLIDGLKFDLRLYVLVLSCEPLRIFLYQDGLVRFATNLYEQIKFTDDEKTMNDVYRHLTNYALNKDNGSFKMSTGVDDDKSHKRSLRKVLSQLRSQDVDTEKLMGEIKDIIIKTLFTT